MKMHHFPGLSCIYDGSTTKQDLSRMALYTSDRQIGADRDFDRGK
jgi:hypothetical protein